MDDINIEWLVTTMSLLTEY